MFFIALKSNCSKKKKNNFVYGCLFEQNRFEYSGFEYSGCLQ